MRRWKQTLLLALMALGMGPPSRAQVDKVMAEAEGIS